MRSLAGAFCQVKPDPYVAATEHDEELAEEGSHSSAYELKTTRSRVPRHGMSVCTHGTARSEVLAFSFWLTHQKSQIDL
jgi:hypothetical protein